MRILQLCPRGRIGIIEMPARRWSPKIPPEAKLKARSEPFHSEKQKFHLISPAELSQTKITKAAFLLLAHGWKNSVLHLCQGCPEWLFLLIQGSTSDKSSHFWSIKDSDLGRESFYILYQVINRERRMGKAINRERICSARGTGEVTCSGFSLFLSWGFGTWGIFPSFSPSSSPRQAPGGEE